MKVGGEWDFDEYDDAYAMWKYRDEAEVGGGRVLSSACQTCIRYGGGSACRRSDLLRLTRKSVAEKFMANTTKVL